MRSPDTVSGVSVNSGNTQFGPYRLDELLGRGGMGEVYRAYDTVRDRVVALKLLNAGLAGDPEYRERFRRESRAAARLGEPHIVPIHDWGEIDGVLYLDMRLVEGGDLRERLTREKCLEPGRAVHVVDQIAAALDAAHADRLIHRDVKPENILVGDRDFAYLVDFGIANAEGDTRLTRAGGAIGSIAYMAPELFDGAPASPASDIYALTCVLFECLTGRVPYPATTISAAIKAAVTSPIPRISAVTPGLPPELDAVIARGLDADPGRRYASAGELAAAAARALSGAGDATSVLRAAAPTAAVPTSLIVDPAATHVVGGPGAVASGSTVAHRHPTQVGTPDGVSSGRAGPVGYPGPGWGGPQNPAPQEVRTSRLVPVFDRRHRPAACRRRGCRARPGPRGRRRWGHRGCRRWAGSGGHRGRPHRVYDVGAALADGR